MSESRIIPPYIPPPPPATPPLGGTEEWARWHLIHSFSPEDAGIIECIMLCDKYTHRARVSYAKACHERKWAGWQAALAWTVIETILTPLEDDIPF